MKILNKFKNRLPFRIIAPVVITSLLIGISLYFIVIGSIFIFLDKIIREDLTEKSRDAYIICDRSLKELINDELLNNKASVDAKKALVTELLIDFIKLYDLQGFLIDENKTTVINNTPEDILKKIKNVPEKVVSPLKHDGKKYYVSSISFEPWNWKILLLKDIDNYAYLVNRIRLAYYAMGGVIVIGTFLLLYYLNGVIKTPLNAIINPIKRGEQPSYKGISEFEFLSNNIREMMALKEKLMRHMAEEKKLKAVNVLAQGIAHNFNNILVVVLGYAAFVRMKLETARNTGSHVDGQAIDEFLKYLEIIETSAQKAGNLSKEMIAISKHGLVGHTTSINVNKLLEEMTRLFRDSVNENIKISTKFQEGIPEIKADVSQIEQAILNIFVNSKDAMPEGGMLTIETFISQLDEYAPTYSFIKPGDYATIKISDTGIGMDKETLDRVFDPFFTTKSPTENVGLGLSTAYSIIKNHKGYIIAESTPNRGTTITIHLPIE